MNYTFSAKAKGRMFGEDVSSRSLRVRQLRYVSESVDYGTASDLSLGGVRQRGCSASGTGKNGGSWHRPGGQKVYPRDQHRREFLGH